MRRRPIAILLVLSTFAAACGSGGGGDTTIVLRALSRARAEARTFRYQDHTLDGKTKVVVEGKVYDDLRYSGTVSLNGRDLYQAIVSDDSMAIRFLDTERTSRAIGVATRADPITGRALGSGQWVVDHTVAPPITGASVDEGEEPTADRSTSGVRRQNLIGDDPFADGSQALNYVESAIRSGFRVELFNPDDIEYNSLDDPWRADAKVELEDEGIRRYDLRLPPLPPPAERGRQQQLPSLDHFRKMAIYVKGQKIIRIREQIDVTDRREFRRAESGRNPEFYLKLRDAAQKGALEDEFRQRTMSYEVTGEGDVDIALPSNAAEGLLANVLPALKELFDFEYIGGGAASRVPPGASPLPGTPPASPTTTGTPVPSG